MKEIQIYCHASCGNTSGIWAYEVDYAKEHGREIGNDIWSSNYGEEQNTTLIQMQFAAVLKSLKYLNHPANILDPDTRNILIHIPSKDIKRWLSKEFTIDDYPTKRDKVRRVYKEYCDEIWIESSTWSVKYKISTSELPKWVLQQLGWVEKIKRC